MADPAKVGMGCMIIVIAASLGIIGFGELVIVPWGEAHKGAPESVRAIQYSDKDFERCLLQEAKKGTYSALDGGRSAIALIGACADQDDSFESRCYANEGRNDHSWCHAQAAILAQAAIGLAGN